jgi:hypothetical protein
MCQVFGLSAPQTPPWRILHNPGPKLKELLLKAKNLEKFITKPQITVPQTPLDNKGHPLSPINCELHQNAIR